jgi:Class III cytochrome C family
MTLMNTRCLFFYLPLAAAVIGGCNGGHEAHRTPGAAMLRLELPARLGAATRPPVLFEHDRHTAALKDKGCQVCHLKGAKGKLSLQFGRTAPLADRDAAMKHYHGRCLTCHAEQEGQRGQPLPQACGACHGNRPAAAEPRKPLRFDTSLHARHVKAAKGKCEGCHADKTYEPLRAKLAHGSCVPCHVEQAAAKKTSGPVDCAGCHTAAKQAKFTKLEAPERLEAKQKDHLLLAGGKAGKVRFNHLAHEATAPFCTTCHHQSMQSCDSCHGKKKGLPTLEAVHHHPDADRSCVGCHRQQTRSLECAGCHGAALASSRRPGKTCEGCHSNGLVAASQPATQPASQPASQLALALPQSGEAFPDELTIKVLAAAYKPSKFPHRKIVARLALLSQKSKLARHFHGSPATLCAGCHHHSPANQKPPPCRSCHGAKGDKTHDRPGLKTAYHRQCLGCHQRMGLKEQGCTDCHAKATENKR